MHDRESAIEEFQFGIGSFPRCNDLLRFVKFNGSVHSVSLDDINFNLAHGLTFYVTVIGVNVLGLETSIISPQVIVDWLLPTPGIVVVGNGTTDTEFQADFEHISATWSEFQDPESDIIEYLYCVGTRPGKRLAEFRFSEADLH